MLKFILIVLLCSLSVRVKGGGHYPIRHFLEEKAGVFREKGKIVNDDLSFLQLALVKSLDGKIWGSLMFAAAAWNPFAAIGFIVGMAPSIGEELGSIGGIKGYWNQDKRDSWFGSALIKAEDQRLWGWLSGILRGLFLGLCLAITTFNPWMLLAGGLFPVAYFIGISIQQIIENKVSVSWYLGELIHGAILGGFLCLI